MKSIITVRVNSFDLVKVRYEEIWPDTIKLAQLCQLVNVQPREDNSLCMRRKISV